MAEGGTRVTATIDIEVRDEWADEMEARALDDDSARVVEKPSQGLTRGHLHVPVGQGESVEMLIEALERALEIMRERAR